MGMAGAVEGAARYGVRVDTHPPKPQRAVLNQRSEIILLAEIFAVTKLARYSTVAKYPPCFTIFSSKIYYIPFTAFPVERVPFCLLDDDRDVERGFGRFLPQQQHDRSGHSRSFILFASWRSFKGPQLVSYFRKCREIKKRTVADIGAALKVELIGPMTAKSKENRMSEPT